MAQQNRADLNNNPFILSGISYVRNGLTLLQDAGRGAADLVKFTLMAKIAATGKWVPFTDETAVDGSAIARGIYMGDDIAAADIVAGDVSISSMLVGGVLTFDDGQLTIENSKTLATVVGAAAVSAHTVQDDLETLGMYVEVVADISGFEN